MAMAQESESLFDLAVDDFYFSALFDEEDQEDIFTVSDEKYAEELQFQEALMASTITSQMTKSASASSLTIQKCLEPKPETIEVRIKADAGESSLNFCEICCEKKGNDQMFKTETCNIHSFCYECISKHVATKIKSGIITNVTCPGLDCKSILEFDACNHVLPKEVLELWEEALCEELIDPSQKFYCPFKDCSAMLVYENEEEEEEDCDIREADCPFCHRLFCAQCYVPWHAGVDCEEFQRLNVDERGREDLMVRELAKEEQWSRCPKCKFYVERTEGCPHMICRCKFEFCYGCEAEWTTEHGGCSRN